MTVKKEATGRRSVQVEVEVPGTPEEVWQAIATGPGISSWMVPAEFEVRDGKPVAVKMNFGPGMEMLSPVTDWEPPRKWATQYVGTPGSPPIANEWSVEARGGGLCIVRFVQSLFASTDDWDDQLEAGNAAWLAFFRALRIYLAHFRGQRSTIMQFVVPFAGSEAEAWESLTAEVGVNGVSVGRRPRVSRRSAAWRSTTPRFRTTPCCGSTSRGRASPLLAPSTAAGRAWLR